MCSPSPAKENSRQSLLLRTDILQKTVVGCPDLISKRIKEILTQKQQYNAEYSSQFNDKNAFRKYKKSIYYFFQISAVCMGLCAYIHATFPLVEIADRFLGQALYRYPFVLLFLFQPPLKVSLQTEISGKYNSPPYFCFLSFIFSVTLPAVRIRVLF